MTVAGSNVAGVDSAYSFNVVTNTLAGGTQDDSAGDRTVQGSLRQFIQNANAIAGANAMRFVPAQAQNAASGGETWWRITVTNELPQITDAFTTIDGTAYEAVVNGAVRNTNTGTLGYAGAVGLGADGIAGTLDDPAPLAGVARPELEIVSGSYVGPNGTSGVVPGDEADDVYIGLDIQTTDVTVRRLSIHGFGHDNTLGATLSEEADIRIGTSTGTFTGSAFDGSGILIEDNVIGVGPASLADPGAGNRSVSGIVVAGPDGGTIQNNVIAWGGRFGAFLTSDSDGWTLEGNHFERNAFENTAQDALDIGNESGGTSVVRNVFFQNYGSGVDGWQGAGGNTIENNLFDANGQGGTEPSAMRLFGTGNVVRYNEIVNSVGDGVLVVADVEWASVNWPSNGNLISRNSFSNNGGIAIDLVQEVAGAGWANNNTGDGITRNVESPGTNAANGNIGLDSPTISTASLVGTTLTVSGSGAPAGGTVEIYRAAGAANDTEAGNVYGEGEQYLGIAIADGAGNWSATFGVAGLLAAGQFVSAIAIDGSNNTSEFGANVTATLAPADIGGTIYEDLNGDAQNADFVALGGVTVRLFQDGGDGVADGADDLFVTSTTTDASGQYSFAAQPPGAYWVVVDSRSVTPSAGAAAGTTWADQTYGAAGALTSSGSLGVAGALYGGRSAAASDNSTDLAASLSTSDHVTRVTLAGADVAGIDSAFSFNVVTNVDGDGSDDDGGLTARLNQGSLHQFILNANATNGPNAMRFVPAVLPNVVDGVLGGGGDPNAGGNDWWRIVVTTALPAITGADTTIDGTAYDPANGTTMLDSNTGMLGAGGPVGVGAVGLAQVARPELEIVDGAAANVIGVGLDVAAANVAIRDLAIYGFGDGTGTGNATGNVRVQGEAYDGVVITGNVIGAGASSFTDPGALARSERHGIYIDAADGGTIQGNLIGFTGYSGIDMRSTWNNWLIEGNEIRGVGQTSVIHDGINLLNGGNLTIQGNLITQNRGPGVDINTDADSVIVVNNTITNNAAGALGWGEETGVRIYRADAGNVVDRNVISGNTGAGVWVTAANAADVTSVLITGNVITANTSAGVLVEETLGSASARIVQNDIYGNGGLGIDLDVNAAVVPLGDGVTANDAGDGDGGPNNRQNFPLITSTSVGAGTVTIGGTLASTAGGSFRIEFFGNDLFQTGGYYEGQRYLGFLDVVDGGLNDLDAIAGTITFSTTLNVVMAASDVVTATATNAATGETSEFSAAGVLIVDTTADTIGGDTSSITALVANKGADGRISLREAILATNATANNGTPDRILFNIDNGVFPLVGGAHTINVGATGLGELPTISDAVLIDATTEPDFVATPVIELNGTSATGDADGLTISGAGAAGTTIRGFVINRFNDNGILITNTSGVVVQGNYIGTNINGTAALGNGGAGIDLGTGAASNTIGGADPNARNVISGNSGDGIQIFGAGTTGNLVQGNYIGIDAGGTADLGNSQSGVNIWGGASSNTIGGGVAAAGNVISGNDQYGVEIDGLATGSNVVQANRIGTTADGSGPLGNAQAGVTIGGGSSNNVIGFGYSAPDETGLANTIAYNGGDGVQLSGTNTTRGNRIAGNDIFANGAGINDLPIDLGANGNGFGSGSLPDAGDADNTGPNNYQNYPEFTGTPTTDGSTLTVYGRLLTPTAGVINYRLHFYASAGLGPSGDGDGERYLGYWDVTNSALGTRIFTATIAAPVADGEYITMTATVLSSTNALSVAGDTSELSVGLQAASIHTISGTIYHDDEGDGSIAADCRLRRRDGQALPRRRRQHAGRRRHADRHRDDRRGRHVLVRERGVGLHVLGGRGFEDPRRGASIAGTVWADQTYGDDSATGALDVAARYGGRNAAVSDNAWDGVERPAGPGARRAHRSSAAPTRPAPTSASASCRSPTTAATRPTTTSR